MSDQIRTLTEAENTIKQLTEKFNFSNYNVLFIDKGKKRTIVASCNNCDKRFEFVKHYATHLTDEDFVGIILHEIAHALAPGHGHDTHFKRVCRRIGGSPNARIDLSYIENSAPAFLLKKVNYIYRCPNCNKEKKTTKKLKRTHSCVTCNPYRFDPRFALVLAVDMKQNSRLQGFSMSA